MANGEGKVPSFTWTAGNIKQIFKGKKDSLKSPEFLTEILLTKPKTSDEKYILKWTLLVKKVVDTEDAVSDQPCWKKRRTTHSSKKLSDESVKRHYLGLYLQNINDELPSLPILKVTFSIIKPTVGKIYSKTKELLKLIKGQNFGISDFMSIEEFDKLKLYNLMLHCEFKEVKKDYEVFEPLLNNKMYSNIQLHVDDKIFPVHKMVLALSSLFFREKIANNDSLTLLEVNDTEEKVFYELLRFFYTGKVRKTEGLEFKLFEAICTYEVWDFFSEFEEFLPALTLENIVPIFLLCDKYFEREEIQTFRLRIFRFVLKNLKYVLNLEAFKNLIKIDSKIPAIIFVFLCNNLEVSKCRRKLVLEPMIQSDVLRVSRKQYESLLNNETYSDINIIVGDEEYHAHKLILGTRSPVFSRMFVHNMKETISGVVEIKDVEPAVFFQVLRFMYTNEFKSENRELVFQILIVADKYAMNDLTFECENILGDSLTKQNVEGTLEFADNHNAKRLERMCVFYYIDAIVLQIYNVEHKITECLAYLDCIIRVAASRPDLYLEFLNRLALDYELVFR